MKSLVFLFAAVASLLSLGTAWQPWAPANTLAGGPTTGEPGDIDCDDDVDSVDALKLLRHVAGLSNTQPQGCPDIGSAPARSRLGGQGVDPGAMQAMSVDMAISGNTATSVVSIQGCARLNANGIQDAEETAVDTLTFDVTAQGIPAKAPMIAFGFELTYNPSTFAIATQDANYLLGANAGSNVFDGPDPLPDTDGVFVASALDTGKKGTEETGSGVLSRLTITAMETAPTGAYPLALQANLHLSPQEGNKQDPESHVPLVTNDATISINEACPAQTGIHGDVDCDGDVDTVDGLRILRDVAALPNELPKGCPPISG